MDSFRRFSKALTLVADPSVRLKENHAERGVAEVHSPLDPQVLCNDLQVLKSHPTRV